MEENEVKTTEETTGTQGAENTDGQANQNEASGEKGEKTFTQAEVDKLITERLAREKAKLKKAEATADKLDTQKASEIDSLKRELADFKAKNACYRAGVRDEYLSDVMTLATANVNDQTDFESALEAVLKRYPNFVKAAPITTGPKLEDKKEDTNISDLRKAFGLK